MKDYVVFREAFAENTWRYEGDISAPNPERALRFLLQSRADVIGTFALIEKERFNEFMETEGERLRITPLIQAVSSNGAIEGQEASVS